VRSGIRKKIGKQREEGSTVSMLQSRNKSSIFAFTVAFSVFEYMKDFGVSNTYSTLEYPRY
jgi:hypothetical protein